MSNKNGSLVITPEELKKTSIEGLSLRPNSSNLTGDAPLTGEQLRARIGALPKLLAERFNELLTNMGMGEGNSVADGIKITAAGTETERTLQEWINILYADNIYLGNIENELKLIAGGETKTLLGWIEFLEEISTDNRERLESAEEDIQSILRKVQKNETDIATNKTDIEEAKTLAQGKSRGRSYASWAEIISALRGYATNTAAKKDFAVGDSLFTVDASADAWVSGFADTSSFPTAPASGKDPFGDGSTVQVGFLILAKADGKTDLSGYVKNTDIATEKRAGIVKVGEGLFISKDGVLSAEKTNASAAANALVGEESGEKTLVMRDVSPIAHQMVLRPQSKNLIPYPYVRTTQTVNGITYTDNGDGTVTVNGTGTGRSLITLRTDIRLPAGKRVTLSGCPSGGSLSSYLMYINVYVNGEWRGEYFDYGNGVGFTTIENGVYTVSIYGNFATGGGYTCNNLVFKPMLEFGTEATAYTHYVPPTESVTLQVGGENMLSGSHTVSVPIGGEALLPAFSPVTTILADRADTLLTASYHRDLNRAFAAVTQRTKALLMASGERGFGFTKLSSAAGTHTAADANGNSVSLTLADSEDGFAMTVDVYSPAMQGGNLSMRIPIATFETESGKRYTIPALPDKTSNNESCDLYYSVDGTPMKGNYIVSPGLDASGAECGYYGAQEYLSDGGTKTLYLNFYSTVPYRASEVLSLLSERTVTLPLPDMGYEIAVTEEKTYTAQTSESATQNTLTLTPIENGVHVSCTHSVDTLGDSFSFEVPIARMSVQKGLYYTVPAMPENTANNYNNGAHFKVELGGVTKAMTENYHPTDDESGEWGELGNFGADNFQATATGTATLYLVLSYTAGNSDNVTTDFDLIFPTVATSGNLTLAPENGTEYRMDVASAATAQLAMPPNLTEESLFSATLRFDTAVAVPSFSYPATYVFAGDDVTGGIFTPAAQKRYCVTLDYDGEKILGKVAEYPV